MPAADLRPILEPRSVALVGASDEPGSLGKVVLANLVEAGFRGEIVPVNPKHATVGGRPAVASVAGLETPPDLAVIVTPARTVPGIVEQCGRRGIRGAIVISAGFRETGEAGLQLERELLRVAQRHGVRFVGPNCLGVIRTDIGFNATFSAGQAAPGSVAVVSQSGALCTAILDWAKTTGVGFSTMVSLGISADVGFGDVLDYLVTDPRTASIMLYIEGVRESRHFTSALRAAARVKPVVVMKVGRHAAGSRAALSHTGALVGADDVFDAALRRAGVLRVMDFADFFAAAAVLDTGMRSGGRRLAIVTNAGGPGVLAADHCADRGIELPELAPATRAKLDAALPAAWSHGNPVDVLGDADPERYDAAIAACLDDPGVDGVLVLLTPQALSRAEDVARRVVALGKGRSKPVLTCWMGGPTVAAGRALFRENDLPTFATPEAAVDAFAHLAEYGANQAQLLQVPEPLERREPPDLASARAIVEAVLGVRDTEHRGAPHPFLPPAHAGEASTKLPASPAFRRPDQTKAPGALHPRLPGPELPGDGRRTATLAESKALLATFGVPILRSIPAHSAHDAVLIAQELGFPVAIKIDSPDITHKSDVGGVRLGVAGAHEVRAAFAEITAGARELQPGARIAGVTVEPMHRGRRARELMVGVLSDPVFGPVLSFGLGGTLVEVLRDRAVALPPLNRWLAASMVDRTRASRLLGAFRGAPPVPRRAVEDLLLRVSEMVCELPWLEEMDLNPVLADENGVTVVDARIVLRPAAANARRYAHMAIHPYPADLAGEAHLPDGTAVTIRPIRPEDAALERDFVAGLSEQTKYLRFLYPMRELTPAMLSRFTQIDYDREMALLAVTAAGDGGGRERELGVARYATLPDGQTCEFAIVVADAWQGRGLATALLARLIDAARQRRLQRMEGMVLRRNERMLAFAKSLGFTLEPDPEDHDLVKVSLTL